MSQEFGPYHKRAASSTYTRWVEGAGARVRGMRQPAQGAARPADSTPSGSEPPLPTTPRSGQRRPATPAMGAAAEYNAAAPASPAVGGADGKKEVWPLHLIEWDNAEQMAVLFALLRRQPEVQSPDRCPHR